MKKLIFSYVHTQHFLKEMMHTYNSYKIHMFFTDGAVARGLQGSGGHPQLDGHQ